MLWTLFLIHNDMGVVGVLITSKVQNAMKFTRSKAGARPRAHWTHASLKAA